MTGNSAVGVEDLLPVRSRVSWGAIFAGATVALALYFLLTLLGGAVGLSVGDRAPADRLQTGAAVWAVLATAVALFVGGYVASQCSVGENRFEAALYGVILWGVLFGMLLWLMASGVRAGFTAMVGMAHAGGSVAGAASQQDWQGAARQAGVSQEQIDAWRQKLPEAGDRARRAAEDPQNQQAVVDGATRVSWWAFFGTLLSMIAAVAGSLAGAGPSFRLAGTPFARPRGGLPASRQPVESGR